jgi:phenylacetate-CoA ligase
VEQSEPAGASALSFRFLLSQVWGEPWDLKLSADEMALRRDERVRSIVRFAFEQVPWYRRAMRDRDLGPDDFRTADDLALLPVAGHADLTSDPAAFLPRNANREDLLELRTSGTTMQARSIYHDPEGMIAGWAVKLRERAVRQHIVGVPGYRSASLSLDGNPTRVRDRFRIIAPQIWKLIPEGRRYSVFEDCEKVVEGLREWRPLHLSGYGSAIGRLFRYLAETGESMPLPRLVTFSSDAMAPAERRIIEEDFGIPVLGIYSATEAFSIGFECGEGEGYHVNEDVTVVRVVDPHGRDAEPGEAGSIIVSNLVNRGTVLLNYPLGDIGSPVAGACPCGRALPRIRLLTGRDTTWIAREGALPIHQYRLFRCLQALGLDLFQTVQTDVRTFTVRIVPMPGQDRPTMESAIRTAMIDLIGPHLDISFEYPLRLEPTKSGKIMSFIRR